MAKQQTNQTVVDLNASNDTPPKKERGIITFIRQCCVPGDWQAQLTVICVS